MEITCSWLERTGENSLHKQDFLLILPSFCPLKGPHFSFALFLTQPYFPVPRKGLFLIDPDMVPFPLLIPWL
jgi:hypothetical protein